MNRFANSMETVPGPCRVFGTANAGLFQSVSAATNNPLLEVNQRMERHLAKISTNTGKHATDIHAP